MLEQETIRPQIEHETFNDFKHRVMRCFDLRGSPTNSGPVDFASEKFPFKLCTLKGFGI